MLDPRIYRAALVPVLFALIVGAFSLSDRPRPIGTTLAPDAFDGVARARPTSTRSRAPSRRAGRATAATRRWPRDAGRAASARSARYQVEQRRSPGRDGRRRAPLTTVIARQVGQPGPGHRRGRPPRRRSAAGRAPSCRAPRRCSSSPAWSAAGACSARSPSSRPAAAAAGSGARATSPSASPGGPATPCSCSATSRGTTVRRPFVAGWSNGDGVGRAAAAPHRRGRRAQGGRHRPGRRARDGAVGAPRLPGHGRRAGAARGRRPARRAAVGRRRAPAAGRRPRSCASRAAGASAARRCARSPRSTTRPTLARARLEPRPRHAAQGAAAVGRAAARRLAAAGAAARRGRRLRARAPPPRAGRPVAVVARSRRRRRSPLALAFAWLLGVTGLLPATPPEPVAAGRDPGRRRRERWRWWPSRSSALLGWIALRPALCAGPARAAGPFRGEGAGAALLVTWCAVAGVLLAAQPLRRGPARPGRARAARRRRARGAPAARPGRRPRRGRRRRRFLLVDLSIAGQLGLSPRRLRLVLRAARRRRRRRAAGLGHLEPRARLPGRRAARGAAQPLERGAAARRRRSPSRGPVSYAGPGSLGGTESALRR